MKYYYDEERSIQNSADVAMYELDYIMGIYNNYLIYGNKDFKISSDKNYSYNYDDLLYCTEEEIIKYLSTLWNIEESEIATYPLRGSVQRDWNTLYYIKNDITSETLDWINTVYFNLGYVIYDEEDLEYYVDSLEIDDIKAFLGDENAELIYGNIEDLKEYLVKINNEKPFVQKDFSKEHIIEALDDDFESILVLEIINYNDLLKRNFWKKFRRNKPQDFANSMIIAVRDEDGQLYLPNILS